MTNSPDPQAELREKIVDAAIQAGFDKNKEKFEATVMQLITAYTNNLLDSITVDIQELYEAGWFADSVKDELIAILATYKGKEEK